ncbi:MAG: zinc ABC transporter substrate-binding protein [Firmicutes bacterium]|nr:zinc ABC transporter substrate-binding protein [Bacillota bacterium]
MKIHTKLVICLMLITAMIAGCSATETTSSDSAGKIKVFTSIYPLYDFASQIGGNKVEVTNIIPPGAEPHTWEPSPKDMSALTEADVIIYCGLGIEPWGDKVFNGSVIDTTNIKLLKASDSVEVLGAEDNDDHSHSVDPHVWLDPLNVRKIVDNITATLVELDGDNKDYYQANASAYKKELDELHHDLKNSFVNVAKNEFVVSHAAFGYLAHRYNLKQVPVRGLSPEVEPKPQDMVDVIKLAKENDINYIFFEKMVSPKVSETIAREIGAETLVLNPMGNLTKEEVNSGLDYISVMRQNMNNLQKALGSKN